MEGDDRKHRSRARVFSVPLGSVTSGRIVFTTSAAGVTLLSEPALQGLVRGRFVRRVSWVGFEEGLVVVGYSPHTSPPPDIHCPPIHRRHGPDRPGDEITLNGSIPWEIEFRGAISDLNADLRGLDLRSLDVLGGASQIRLLLSKPAGTAFLYITGGIRDGTIRIPPGFGVRVQIGGGISNLLFDSRNYASSNEGTNLEKAAFRSATSRCDICIFGGVSNLTIEE